MHQIAPGIHHWTALHPNIGIDVSSYWLPDIGVLLDPLAVPDEVEGATEIVLSNRHHTRDAFEASRRFGAPVRVPRVALDELSGEEEAEPYDFEQPLAGGAITPYEVTELWPGDGALHIASLDTLAIADAVIHYDGELQFVPEQFMDDPEAEKRGIRDGLRPLAEKLEFRHLLVAHGSPIADEGRERLQRFVDAES